MKRTNSTCKRKIVPFIIYILSYQYVCILFIATISQFLILILMRKTKGEKGSAVPLALSSKRASLNQDKLVEPYKMEWKVPLQNVDNNSKVFFQNMKAELSNIKNDFEKLIRKEITLKGEKEDNPKSTSTNKPKHNSSYKKDEKRHFYERYPENEKIEIISKNQLEPQDYFSKISDLEKNLPCAQYRTNIPKATQIKENIMRSATKQGVSDFQPIEIFQNNYLQAQKAQRNAKECLGQSLQKDEEMKSLKEDINRLKDELSEAINERNFTKSTVEKLFMEKNILLQNNSKMSRDYQAKSSFIEEQNIKIEHLCCLLRQSEQKRCVERDNTQSFDQERHFYNERINELVFHNQNLGGINMQLAAQCQALKEKIANLQRFMQDMKKRSADNDNDVRRKIQYMQKDLQEYHKREDMFMKEIQKVNRQLGLKEQGSSTSSFTLISQQPAASEQALLSQIALLRDQNDHLNNQVRIEKEIHSALSAKYEQHIASLKIQQLSRQFQQKINHLTDQNYKIRNRANLSESNNESLAEQIKFYKRQMEEYEDREKHLVQNKRLRANEWEELTEQIERLKQQNKTLSDSLQSSTLQQGIPLESQVYVTNLNTEESDSLLKMAHNQLLETKQLKETIKQLSLHLKAEGQKVQNLRMMNDKLKGEVWLMRGDVGQIEGVKRRHEQLFRQWQLKEAKLKNMKDLFFKVLIEKINKKEDQQQIEYYLKEIDARLALI